VKTLYNNSGKWSFEFEWKLGDFTMR